MRSIYLVRHTAPAVSRGICYGQSDIDVMESFYDELLVNGEPTATALRSAKLKMLKDKRWNAPYYWAGFVLHGEHTNRIAVERSSKFAFVSVFALAVILASSALIVFQRRSRREKPA